MYSIKHLTIWYSVPDYNFKPIGMCTLLARIKTKY